MFNVAIKNSVPLVPDSSKYSFQVLKVGTFI